MRSALRDVIDGCLDTFASTPRNEWIQDWPSQVGWRVLKKAKLFCDIQNIILFYLFNKVIVYSLSSMTL